jgi:soluble lytic murein transglycosylase-like protein
MKRCFLLLVLLAVPARGQIPAQANIYRARLTREARAVWGLEAPVALFAAQIHQESGWREDARSPVGALGLAQFMPGTAAWIAQLYPVDLGEAAPLDARWALRALVTYDRWLWERLTEFRDEGLHRWGATLSAYNGGLGNVRKDRQLACTELARRVYPERSPGAAARGTPFYTERSERSAGRSVPKLGDPCDPAVSRWFCFTLSEAELCVERWSNRSAAAFRENREYARRILFLLWPRYHAARW